MPAGALAREAAPALQRHLAATLATLLTLTAVGWALDVPRRLSVLVYTEQFLAAILALALALIFLRVRPDRSTGGAARWYDLAAATLGFGAAGYVALAYPRLALDLAFAPAEGVAVASLILVLVLEALRRTTGPVLVAIVLLFLAYGVVGHLVPGELAGRAIAYDRLVTQLVLDTNGLLGAPLRIAATVVVVFLLLGIALNRAGGAVFFTDLAMAAMGRYRGGPAKISILASSLFGSVSGSAVSNVATTGIITIPLMQRAGFRAPTAAGIEAVASTGGQLMPPIMGASAFLMAEFLAVPYAEVILAALVPALLYYAALFVQADLTAARDGFAGAAGEVALPRLGATLKGGWIFPLPFAVLIAGLFSFNLRPEEAGLYAVATLIGLALLVGAAGRRLAPSALLTVLRDAGFAALDVILITAAAGLVIGVLNLSGLSFGLTLVLVALSGESLPLLLLVAALISIVLGMGMPTIGVYVLLAALVAPAMVELAIEPIAAHLFVLYFGMMSMITPPIAIAAFAAASLARADPMGTALEAMRFGWPAYVVPFLFVVSPALILVGSPGDVALAVTTAILGVGLVSAALVGHLAGALGPASRIVTLAAGAALLAPHTGEPRILALNAAGLAAAALLIAVQRTRATKAADRA